ncbi:hypothetical protein [Paenibacillus agaridevorans]|nr:hypothetical protein [Paenibacillus agaridevorans]
MGMRRVKLNMHPYLKVGLSIVMIGTILLIFGIAQMANGKDEAPGPALLSVDGIPVDQEEFELFLQDEKAATASYFARQYSAEYSGDFWETAYGDEVPIEVARSNALDKLVRIKAEQQVAAGYRLIKSAEFQDVQQAMRKAEKSIYGAESLSPLQEYMLFHGKLVLEAKNQFKEKLKAVPEEVLLERYEANRQLFQAPDELTAWQVSWTGDNTEEEQEAAYKLAEDIRNGIPAGQLLPKYKRLHSLRIQEKQYGKQEGKDENSSDLGMMLKEQAYQLSPNQTSEVMSYGNQHFVVLCTERSRGEGGTFDEVKLLIEDAVKEERFEQQIDQAVSQAAIVKDEAKWNELQMK